MLERLEDPIALRAIRLTLALALALALAAAGCAKLKELDPDGTCGNSIVESASEDCDTYTNSKHRCGPAGQVGACRYLCIDTVVDLVVLQGTEGVVYRQKAAHE